MHYPRNRPCPCGSGRKFKRCCGHGDPRKRLAALKRSRWQEFKAYMHRVWHFNRIEGSRGRRLQFVWWWAPYRWRVWLKWVPYPADGSVYTWRIQFGPLEVRRWAT